MFNFTPVLSRIKAPFVPPAPVLENVSEVVELEPGSVTEVAPAISLPGELDRVKQFYGGPSEQVPRLTSLTREEAPTLSYRLDGALLADFTLYTPGGYFVYRPGGKRPVIIGEAEVIEEAQLCTTSCAEMYFGHFLREALPLELLAHERGLLPLSFAHDPWVHEAGYREMVGLEPCTTQFARVRTLWLVDETALNSGWTRRIGEIRRRVRESVTPSGDSHVFLARGSLGASRDLTNLPELTEALERRGFRIIEPETMEPEAICAILAGAKVVGCVEGSVHNHALLAMPAGAALVSIQPPHRFNAIGKVVADAVGLRFAYVVAEPAEKGFRLDPSRFMRTVDLVERDGALCEVAA